MKRCDKCGREQNPINAPVWHIGYACMVNVYAPKEQKCEYCGCEIKYCIDGKMSCGCAQPKDSVKCEHNWIPWVANESINICTKCGSYEEEEIGATAYESWSEMKHPWSTLDQYDKNRWIEAGKSVLRTFKSPTPPLSVKWPEKKNCSRHYNYNQNPNICDCGALGWNACLEACKKAIEENNL